MEKSDSKILVVDDNAKNIQLLAKLLSDSGYNIEAAMSGAEALYWVQEEEFDLILLDIMMPEMDGFEVCDKIKLEEKNKDLPIIFLTAKTDVESITLAFSKGGYDYLTKPFNTEELLARVRTQIELKKSKDQLKKVNQWLEEKVAERTKELKESNEELAIAKEELEVLDNAKTEFLKILSHEVRTPLNGIMGGLELLKDTELPEETTDFISILDESVKRLESFSLTALDIAQIRTNGAEILRKENLFVNQLLNKCIENKLLGIEQKNLKIDMSEIQDDIYFAGDNEFTSKCFNGIIANAINFSPENGTITINAFEKDDNVHCIIKDQGSGFPAHILSSRFQPFAIGNEHIDQFKGLGLNLAKLIMDAHSGEISLSNGSDGGAIVSLLFKKDSQV
ncbi:MAG: hybrid sensor histidine kinase/response regulator [Bacteroidetes bacterium]|nr:hybrid sensor histidine kinase/response regulator [Bacteroidota bacterium]MBL6943028.1 hybrid sensor histidine kinase/response regulator [Bacteroidales bacterium]